jgi:hypothetical protein
MVHVNDHTSAYGSHQYNVERLYILLYLFIPFVLALNHSWIPQLLRKWCSCGGVQIHQKWYETKRKKKTGSILKIYYKIILQKVGTSWPQLIFGHLKSLIASAITIFMSFAVYLWENLTWMSLEWCILETKTCTDTHILFRALHSLFLESNQKTWMISFKMQQQYSNLITWV